MKKLLLASLVAIVPSIASAQQLVSGYNFGQFIGPGDAATDPETFEDYGFIGANWAEGNPPPGDSPGNLANYSPAYENNTGRVYWNGLAGSDNLVGTGNIMAWDNEAAGIGGDTLSNTDMSLLGDHNGANMALAVQGGYSIGFIQNMSGFADAGGTDLTFSAQSASGQITISWIYNGATIATTNVGTVWSAYTVDLPSEFYGASASELTATFSGAGRIDNVQFNGVSAIPEPSTYAAIFGVTALVGAAAVRRRRAKASATA